MNFIDEGAYHTGQHEDRKLEDVDDTEIVLETAKECLENAQVRRFEITTKCKTLFTLSSLLLGLIGVLVPDWLQFGAMWMRIVCFVAILALINTIFLLLAFFDIGRETVISLDQSQVDLKSVNYKKCLINLYLRCQVATDNRTDYLVDLYKVARFFFLTAFTVVLLLFSINFLSSSPTNKTEKIIRTLRSDSQLLELLRGPKGQQGTQGRRGEKGHAGRDAVVDESKLINRILDDPRLEQKLKKLTENSNRQKE